MFGLVIFYHISTLEGYLMPNPVYIYMCVCVLRKIDNKAIQVEGEIY